MVGEGFAGFGVELSSGSCAAFSCAGVGEGDSLAFLGFGRGGRRRLGLRGRGGCRLGFGLWCRCWRRFGVGGRCRLGGRCRGRLRRWRGVGVGVGVGVGSASAWVLASAWVSCAGWQSHRWPPVRASARGSPAILPAEAPRRAVRIPGAAWRQGEPAAGALAGPPDIAPMSIHCTCSGGLGRSERNARYTITPTTSPCPSAIKTTLRRNFSFRIHFKGRPRRPVRSRCPPSRSGPRADCP